MPEVTERFTEVVDVLAAIAPITANGAVGAHSTAYVSLADYHRAFVLLHVGTPGGASTIDVAITQATDTSGTGAKAITGKAITTITAADTEEYVGMELNTDELDVSAGFCTICATVTVGIATYTYSLYVFGLVSRYEPVGVTDFAEVVA